ncbi:Di-sulfide bridge nucleocytoplasmic transport domain-containing protein [Cokeromyces recurvatus]|uniref:Di-sulfide bridge nucleocytoplasmic transport domain-containing protein n=1 Tax=Cokeromyces recurvatus TaxID=90255 RepID=UPI0022201482|nr:Di-sulfide bridge nucleocytoplasmic transport domain-containing protein [Cokeromyces recurvatus]KAI7906385.1 Di-sulfide bridge nucleocytoplasmic transport domain-containing protein [Cokeromyces recurvatus]
MDYQYTDEMEFEYTEPLSFPSLNEKLQTVYTLPPSGTFHIPQSLFGNNYTKLSSTTNTVCNLLNEVTLNDKETERIQEQEDKQTKMSKSLQLLPKDNSLKVNDSKDRLEIKQSVDQFEIPNAIASLPTPTDEKLKSPVATSPSQVFIYNAAPSTDEHINHSHSVIYYINGLFKLFYTSILFMGALYIIIHLIRNIHYDIKDKIATYESDLFGDQLYCQQQYELNRCSPNTRLPAIQDLCREWERCMMRPLAVSKSKVLAETLAEMVNGFLNTLTLKTMVRRR